MMVADLNIGVWGDSPMGEQSGGDAGNAGRVGHEPGRTLRGFGSGIGEPGCRGVVERGFAGAQAGKESACRLSNRGDYCLKLANCVNENIEDMLIFYDLPMEHRKAMNMQKRMNQESSLQTSIARMLTKRVAGGC